MMGDSRDNDAELMLRVKSGDIGAFEVLVDRHKQPVFNFVYRILPDATEAEDVTQAVFVQVYKSASRYQVSAKFTTWLFTIARNLCFNEIRRRSRHPAWSLDALVETHGEELPRQFEDLNGFGPQESALQSELEEKVSEVVRELPENQRTALLLCSQEELSYEGISEVLGCSLSATKSLIHRARETLKHRLKPYLRSGAWVAKTT